MLTAPVPRYMYVCIFLDHIFKNDKKNQLFNAFGFETLSRLRMQLKHFDA